MSPWSIAEAFDLACGSRRQMRGQVRPHGRRRSALSRRRHDRRRARRSPSTVPVRRNGRACGRGFRSDVRAWTGVATSRIRAPRPLRPVGRGSRRRSECAISGSSWTRFRPSSGAPPLDGAIVPAADSRSITARVWNEASAAGAEDTTLPTVWSGQRRARERRAGGDLHGGAREVQPPFDGTEILRARDDFLSGIAALGEADAAEQFEIDHLGHEQRLRFRDDPRNAVVEVEAGPGPGRDRGGSGREVLPRGDGAIGIEVEDASGPGPRRSGCRLRAIRRGRPWEAGGQASP